MTKSKDKYNLDVTIGNNIRIERETRRIRRDEFAKLIDISPSHLGLIERGERGATPLNLSKISQMLNVPIGHFFNGAGAENEITHDTNANPQLLKLQALASCISEHELDLLIHITKGLIGMSVAREE